VVEEELLTRLLEPCLFLAAKRSQRLLGDALGVDDAERILRHPPRHAHRVAEGRLPLGALIADVQGCRVDPDEGPVHVEQGGSATQCVSWGPFWLSPCSAYRDTR